LIGVLVGAATSAGRVRELNEDNFVAVHPVYAVADGMGGHAAGEVASGIAVAELGALSRSQPVQPSAVGQALDEANEQILFKGSQVSGRAGMGTTATGLIAVEAAGVDHWLVFNVGDSRVYRFAGGSLQQLSTDHSEVQELVELGEITTEQARTHPRRNVVTRCLGTKPGPKPDQWLLPPSLGERFLICSDGLSGELSDADIEEELRCGTSPQQAVDNLVARAVAAGGRDNVTVLLVEVISTSDSSEDDDTVPRGMA
jgi:protein phosphatase